MNKNGFVNQSYLTTNINELIKDAFKRYEKTDFYGYEEDISQETKKKNRSRKVTSNKEIKWMTYDEVYKDAKLLKSFIQENKKLFLAKNDTKLIIAIYANKSYEFLVTILASMILNDDNIFLFPLYDMMDIHSIDNILGQVKPNALFIDKACMDTLLKLYLLDSHSTITSYLNTIVLYDNDKEKVFNSAQVSHLPQYLNIVNKVTLMNFSDMLKSQQHYINDSLNHSNKNINNNNNALSSMEIIAVSSTHHRLCCIKSIELLCTINDLLTFDYFHYDQHDIYYQTKSFGDISEIVFLLILIQSGSRIFFCNNLSDFFSTIDILHPTILNNYPYIWKKIYMSLQNIILSLNNEQHSIVTKAIKARMKEDKEYMESDCHNNIKDKSNCNVWDKFVFDKIKMKFGSKIRLLFTSNDLLNSTISKFLTMCLKAKMIQIYGTTETCGFISIGDNYYFHLGKRLPSKQISIEICNEIGYYSLFNKLKEIYSKYIEESCGEIIITGNGLYSGYYNDSSITTPNHIFHTGDYGMMIQKKTFYDTINETNNEPSRVVFIEKISNFLYNHQNCPISPSITELSFDETFNGKISNIYLSKRDDMNQLAIVGRVNMSDQCENPEKIRLEAINELSKYIEGHSLRNELIPHANDKKNNLCIFLIEKFEKVFTVTYKMNRSLLKKEINLRDKDN